jgi:hypothetical protein
VPSHADAIAFSDEVAKSDEEYPGLIFHSILEFFRCWGPKKNTQEAGVA